ncbi:MAG: hypothetical protein R3338_01355 [Thermoanaerobaculia bacterium]|nr:hypothetical protein [Thermoanaerobaculia bacterium]
MKKLSLLLALALSLTLHAQQPGLEFGDEFWAHWGDGKAELSGYDLKMPRYGEVRDGTAALIFVTEPFTVEPRVKADGPNARTGTVFQVMKLNLIRDFPTGIYDYNTMSSVFVGLEPFAGLPAGSPAKVTFSSQEWCGQVWEQATYHPETIDVVSHSYFGGEADQAFTIERGGDLWTEDQLFHWARGFALPDPERESAEVRMLPTLLEARLSHDPLEPRRVRLRRSVGHERIEVPAGTFETTIHEAESTERTWRFWVETDHPHRIVQWRVSTGERGRLRGSERLPYWEMNKSKYEEALSEIGLGTGE